MAFDFSIIIVAYNSEDDIIQCLESINNFRDNYRIEIIIIDNSPSNQTYNLLESVNLINVKLIKNNTNVGFAVACNQGAMLSEGGLLVFFNPDTIIVSDIFEQAQKQFEDSTIGCLGPQILTFDNTEAAFALKFPHPPFSLIRTFFKNLFNKSNAKILQINFQNNSESIDCDWVLGACMFIPKVIFTDVGGFDEQFFLYFEDVDICKRIKMKGYRIVANRKMIIKHKKQGSSKYLPRLEYMKIRIQSELYYYRKHHGTLGYLLSKYFDRKGYIFRA